MNGQDTSAQVLKRDKHMACRVRRHVLEFFFDPKNMKKQPSKVAHNRPKLYYFTVQPRPQPTAHSRELIFHIMKSWDQTSVLLSVIAIFHSNYFFSIAKPPKISPNLIFCSIKMAPCATSI